MCMCVVYLHKGLTQVEPFLNELAMLFEEGAEEQAQVLDEILFIILPVGVGQANVCVQRQHLQTNPKNELTSTSITLHIMSCTRSVLTTLRFVW